jgi:hypothetical protein
MQQEFVHRSTVATTAGSLVSAPLLILASALVMPKLSSNEQVQLQTIAAHSARYLWFTLLLLAGTMLLVPAFHGLVQLVPGSPGLRLGAGLVVFGAMASVGDTTTQFLIREMATRGGATARMAAVVDGFDSAPGPAQLFALGGIALVVGVVAAAVALRRSGVIRTAVAAALAVAIVVNLVGFIAQSTPVIVASAALLLVAMGAIAPAVSRAEGLLPAERAGGSGAGVPLTQAG